VERSTSGLPTFPDEQAAAAFRAAVASRWPGGVPAAARLTNRPAWVVGVVDDALPLTEGFRAHQAAIQDLDGRFGGDYTGYGV
jgi:hypothetical protein